jgi:hypothetical protein
MREAEEPLPKEPNYGMPWTTNSEPTPCTVVSGGGWHLPAAPQTRPRSRRPGRTGATAQGQEHTTAGQWGVTGGQAHGGWRTEPCTRPPWPPTMASHHGLPPWPPHLHCANLRHTQVHPLARAHVQLGCALDHQLHGRGLPRGVRVDDGGGCGFTLQHGPYRKLCPVRVKHRLPQLVQDVQTPWEDCQQEKQAHQGANAPRELGSKGSGDE